MLIMGVGIVSYRRLRRTQTTKTLDPVDCLDRAVELLVGDPKARCSAIKCDLEPFQG